MRRTVHSTLRAARTAGAAHNSAASARVSAHVHTSLRAGLRRDASTHSHGKPGAGSTQTPSTSSAKPGAAGAASNVPGGKAAPTHTTGTSTPSGGPAGAAGPAGGAAAGNSREQPGLGVGGLVMPIAGILALGAAYYVYQNGLPPALGGTPAPARPPAPAPPKPVTPPPKPAAAPAPAPPTPETKPKAAAPAPAKPSPAEGEEKARAAEVQAANLAANLAAAEAADTAAGAKKPAAAETKPVEQPAAPGPAASTAAATPAAQAPQRAEASAEQEPARPPTPFEEAKKEAHAWAAGQLADILRKDIETTTQAEVAGLSVTELRERIYQLHSELQLRGKFEALRLAEFVEQNDAVWEKKFEAALDKEKTALEVEARATLDRARHQLQEEYATLFERERRRLEDELSAQASAKLRRAQQDLFARVAEETESRIQEVSKLGNHVEAVDAALRARSQYEQEARKVHRIALSTLAALAALNRVGPATQELAALKVAASGDRIIATALDMLPEGVHSAKGVPSLHALQTRFISVAEIGKRAALTPEGGGVLGQAVGAATSKLVLPTPAPAPNPRAEAETPAESSSSTVVRPALSRAADAIKSVIASVSGSSDVTVTPPEAVSAAAEKVQGGIQPIKEGAEQLVSRAKELAAAAEDRTSDIARVNSLFERAQSAVATGDLPAAVDVLGTLRGYAGEAVKDWIAAANQRIATDRAMEVTRSRAVVLTARMY